MVKINQPPSSATVMHRQLILPLLVVLVTAAIVFVARPAEAAVRSSEIVALENTYRIERGVVALQRDPVLDRAASRHARNMFLKQYFSHTSPTGRRFTYWLGRIRSQYQHLGENLAVGHRTSAGLLSAWTSSDGHRRNLLDRRYDRTGLAVISGTLRGRSTTIVVQYFAQSQTAPHKPLLPADADGPGA